MKTMKIYKTGFNPDVNSNIGTSNEQFYYETTSSKDCLASIIKNEQFVVEEPCYLVPDIIVEDNQILDKTE